VVPLKVRTGQEVLVKRSTRFYAIIGAVVVLLGAGVFIAINVFTSKINNSIPQANLFGTPTASARPSITAIPTPTPAGMEIDGALNILVVGVDTRTYFKGWVPHADAVMIMHVDPDHLHAYLTSLPRDLLVDIPAFGPSHFGGERSKLTHAMAFGSMVGPDPQEAYGFQLLAQTVSNYTGIKTWNGGAVLTFQGMKNVVDTLGGIDLYIDEKTVSIHLEPNGTPRPVCDSCDHGFGGPQATYNVGQAHLNGWQTLDYARQRYIDGAAYARERHQRQVIKAMITKIINTDFMTSPTALLKFFRALGSNLLFDGRGHEPIDFAYTLRHLTPDSLTLVGLPGGAEYDGGEYQGEDLDPIQAQYFTALRNNQAGAFLKAHPTLINDPKPSL
jgi:anionic cell wall polymer biosynthesis LytR-Cps2A-Psr (LCP) family protein